MKIKTSPISYMGNKKKLLSKGLAEMFPNDINTFIEPFCGSGVVSMNISAELYLLNDRTKHVIDLLKMFKMNKSEDLILELEDRKLNLAY